MFNSGVISKARNRIVSFPTPGARSPAAPEALWNLKGLVPPNGVSLPLKSLKLDGRWREPEPACVVAGGKFARRLYNRDIEIFMDGIKLWGARRFNVEAVAVLKNSYRVSRRHIAAFGNSWIVFVSFEFFISLALTPHRMPSGSFGIAMWHF